MSDISINNSDATWYVVQTKPRQEMRALIPMLDPLGHVAELATANIFYAQDGKVHTPVPNGTFLSGITRARVIGLLRDAGIEVFERTLTPEDFAGADEIFSTGNWGKVMPVSRFEERDLQPGPIFHRARELYWEFSHS